jgi:hypothetical protein
MVQRRLDAIATLTRFEFGPRAVDAAIEVGMPGHGPVRNSGTYVQREENDSQNERLGCERMSYDPTLSLRLRVTWG